jgi:signal transduction histidine kinase
LVIRDTGLGIPESVHDHLYEPFVTAERENANGLGATIAKQVVDYLGGRITHSSESGKGAEFTVYLPAIAD